MMDTLHDVMRSISGERKCEPRRDHLTVVREFLDHLDRASKRRATGRLTRIGKNKSSRGKRA
jgi:hypothetical protein